MKLNTLMMFFDDAQGSGLTQTLSLIIPMALLAIVFYFFIYRPQKKQEKETSDMRNSIEIGDVIVTSGGIVGMVVKIKDVRADGFGGRGRRVRENHVPFTGGKISFQRQKQEAEV